MRLSIEPNSESSNFQSPPWMVTTAVRWLMTKRERSLGENKSVTRHSAVEPKKIETSGQGFEWVNRWSLKNSVLVAGASSRWSLRKASVQSIAVVGRLAENGVNSSASKANTETDMALFHFWRRRMVLMAARFVTQRNPKCARKFNRAAFLVHGVQLKPPSANGKKPFCDRTEARKGTSSNRLVTGKWKKISEALNWNEIYYTKLRTANWISSFSVRSCRGDNTSRLWDTADIPNKINKLFFNWYPPWIFYAQPKSRKKIPSSMRTSVVSLMYKYWHLATSENQVMYYWVGRRCNCV